MQAGLGTIAEIKAAPRTSILGAEVPESFGDLACECEVVRAGAGVFDASFRTWLRMTGEDRLGFLHGMVSNDVRQLAPGEGVCAAHLTAQGKVVSDLRVYAERDALLLDLPTAGAVPVRQSLEKHIIADDVEIAPAGLVLIGLEGPRVAAQLAPLGVPVPRAGLRLAERSVAGVRAQVAAASSMGETGVVVGCGSQDAPALWKAFRDAGAEPVGARALNVLRLEAGIPWVGTELGEEILLLEAGLDEAVSFTKGCYLGQEVVERIAARGHVNRRRVGVCLDGDPVPGRTPLCAEEGITAGWLTSTAYSPRLRMTVGMAYVHRRYAAAGVALWARVGERRVAVRVAALPLRSGAAGCSGKRHIH